MKFKEVWKNFAPGFVGGLMSAILLAIILGYEPSNIGTWTLTYWVVGLFIIGTIFTWLILLPVRE